ncbi:MAG: DUF2961 domain-containing protein [Candidatus Aminicenantes bacterium]|nr:DUF2961 domain-containing protein [Candidatus Aminicenantes bacterium]
MKKLIRILGCIVALLFISAEKPLFQELDSLSIKVHGRSMRASSGNIQYNRDAIPIEAGETKILGVLEGPGKVAHIWMTIFSQDLRYPRSIVLRIYWDGSKIPSVETPVGDFFGCGNGMKANINSLPVKVHSYGRAYNCYWVMPFQKEAKITLTNESDKRAPSIFYMIDWQKLEKVPDDMMYFHARYHQEYPVPVGEPYVVFKGMGSGHYVGTVLSSQAALGHWIGEGDDFWYIDGEEVPSLVGCGTEDYFNDAWNMRVHSGMYTGCTVFEPRCTDARITAYRWHIPDPVIFSESLKLTIERKGFIIDEAGNTLDSFKPRPDKWSSVSFWYQNTIAEPWCEFPPLEQRVDPEVFYHLPKIINMIKHSDQVVLEELTYNRPCFDRQGLLVKNDAVGSWIEIPFQIIEKGLHVLSIFQLLREDNGIWKVYIDDKEIYEAGESQIPGGYQPFLAKGFPPDKINNTLDFFNIYRFNEHEDISYGQNLERRIGLFDFEPGEHRLKLVCVGANPLAVHPLTRKPFYNLTADILSVRKIPFDDVGQWIDKMLEMENRKK